MLPADLVSDVERAIFPMRVIVHDGIAGLVHREGATPIANYATGPTDALALLAAEQRYLAEQGGADRCVAGATYLEKAHERLRRWEARPGN